MIIDTSIFVKSFLGNRCRKTMGMQSGQIRNNQITASSQWDKNHGPELARLNILKRGARIGAWSAKYNNRYQWLQVDLGHPSRISRIFTQGRQDYGQWVTRFKVRYSQDGIRFVHQMAASNIRVGKKKLFMYQVDCNIFTLQIDVCSDNDDEL